MRKFFCLCLILVSIGTSYGAKKYKLVEIETNLGVIKVKLYQNTPVHSENFLKLAAGHHFDSLLFHRVIKDFMIQGGASDSRGASLEKRVGIVDPGYTLEAEIRPGNHHYKGALAAARQGDEINPQKRSSGEQFYIVQGKTYTDAELDQIENKKLITAKNRLGDSLFRPLQQTYRDYIRTGRKMKADSLIHSVQQQIERRFAGTNPFAFSPEVREFYKSVGGTPFLDGDYTVFGEIVEGMDVLDKIAAVKTDERDRPLEDVIILHTKLKRK